MPKYDQQNIVMNTVAKYSLYQHLMDLPEQLTGEILNGQLYTQPRPAGPHAWAETALGSELTNPYGRGKGGPGGWWILIEPEIHFIRDTEVLVPDLAGWRRERMPSIPRGHRFEVVPDWICEILSPSTESKDRCIKMPIYSKYGVANAWLIDPEARALETYELQQGEWLKMRDYTGDAPVTAPPFDAVYIDLGALWV